MDRFAYELLRAWLPRASAMHDIRTLVPAKANTRDTKTPRMEIEKVGALTGHPWEQFELPGFAATTSCSASATPAQ